MELRVGAKFSIDSRFLFTAMGLKKGSVSSLVRDFATASRIFQMQGVKGVLSVLMGKLDGWLRRNDNWWVGKFVEIRGNVVTLDGCRFSVNNPAISTALKSRFLFDRYETPERDALKQFLNPELPVIEFGGSIGIISCLTNKKLYHPSRHIVVEANPDLLPLLEENRDRNGCRFTILHRAVAYGSNQVTFHQDDEFLAGSIQRVTSKSVQVPTISLRDIIAEYDFEPCTLICDIEGGEIDLVQYEADTLRHSVATLVLEAHGKLIGADVTDNMLLMLKTIGFHPVYSKYGRAHTDGVYVFQNGRVN